MKSLTRILIRRHVRRQMQMTRREYRQFIEDCFNSAPWDDESDTMSPDAVRDALKKHDPS